MRGLIVLALFCCAQTALGQLLCPQDWRLFNNKCWYFSLPTLALETELSWHEAESKCQEFGGHLACFETKEEEDWVYRNNIRKYQDTKWWIGLNDINYEGNWEWIDSSIPYDSGLNKWRIGEPNNDADEDCVEAWVFKPVYPAMWNDNSCDRNNRYICSAPSGQSDKCPQGWTEREGSDSCYRAQRDGKNWHDADQECKSEGGWLVSVQSQQEQDFVQSLISSYDDQDWFIGYSDTANPGTLAWVDPSAANNGYSNWNSGSAPNPLPYQGSTCAVMKKDYTYKWSAEKCGGVSQFVCERGLKGDCPAGWTLLNGKCYELVANPNRVQTWTTAKAECQRIGAQMLKVESEQEQIFVGSVMEMLRSSGISDVWLGASDIGHDGQWRWFDGTTIDNLFWASGFPNNVQGRDDCVTLYTGKNTNNWEHGDCFRQLPYMCTVPEGAKLTPGGQDHITVDGNCDEGWRHYKGKCYFFDDTTTTHPGATQNCENMGGAMLTSVLDPNEQSFIVGHLRARSWIGLKDEGAGYVWTDGSTTNFFNWDQSAGKSQPCVSSDLDGNWLDSACNQIYAYVCKKDDNEGTQIITPPTSVPGDNDKCGGRGWFSDPASTQCYLMNTDVARTWYDARSACQSQGGDLASINSPDEQKFVQTVLSGVPTVVNVWIGLIDANPFNNDILDLADSGWAWSDDSPLPFINWAEGEPNDADDEDCGELYVGDGTWNDVDCYQHRHYICEKPGDMSSIIGDPDETIECKPNEECCFRHLGAEYGGGLDDGVMVASSEDDYYFRASRGRLNTPDDVVDLPNLQVGKGHGGWKSASTDQQPWLQVDFPVYKTVKGIITQGRNGIGQITDRDWVTKFQLAFSEDPKHKGAEVQDWQYVSGRDGQPITFDGNHDQNTEISNVFPREVVALHMRLYVIEYFDEPVIRLEYIGCAAACLHALGMSNGLFLDSDITASSSTSGHEPKQARPASVPGECLTRSGDAGTDYRGYISKTQSGLNCQPWKSQTPHTHQFKPEDYPDANLHGNECRNPDGRAGGPWCYTEDPAVEWESCNVPVCPSYTPTGWSPQAVSGSWIQVGFGDYYKVNGIAMFGSTSQYVSSYSIAFSDDGVTFNSYKNTAGVEHIFGALDGTNTRHEAILHESVGTKYLRIIPKTYQGGIRMQFEVNGCYNERRISCSDTGKEFDSGLNSDFTIDCPAGCAQDPLAGPVYGGDPNYSETSALCPAAIHYGSLNDFHGGPITFRKETGQSKYTGSFQNNIMSLDSSGSTNSLSFEGKVWRCDDDSMWKPWKDHCYHLSPKGVKKTWHDARLACQDMGGDLVTIASVGENDFIEFQVGQGDRGGDVWIGLNDQQMQNYYQWADGSKVTFTKWSFNEPNGGEERCVHFIRLEGYWNDLRCDTEIPYMCKREKQLLPKLDPADLPVEEGCDPGWSAYESSCYLVSSDVYIFVYAQEICEEKGGNMVSIHNDYEQAFVHQLVQSKLPLGYNYTAWIGLAGRISDEGQIVYLWESDEITTYTNWDTEMPQTRFGCVFPFTYRGKTYYECTTENHPALLKDTPWCSMTAEYKGFWMNCGNQWEYACTYLNPLTGHWSTDICGARYYYVCEKDRVGYTQPVYTTPNPALSCAAGWDSEPTMSYCYRVEEAANEDQRRTWSEAVDYCRKLGGDLVSIHSPAEEQAVISVVQRHTTNSYTFFWIGLNNINSAEGYEWSDGSAVDYFYWTVGEPNNAGGVENCIEGQFYTNEDGWNDLPCDEKRNTICKIAKGQTPNPAPTDPPKMGTPDPRCGRDYDWIRYQTSYGADKCYLFKDSDSTMTWSAANDFCRGQGGQLVSVHSSDENDLLVSRTVRSDGQTFWIGLHDIGGRAFTWADGSTVDYVNWAPGEPNNFYDSEGCTNFYGDSGTWNDDNCGIYNWFICEKFMGAEAVTVPPTVPQQGNCPAGFTGFGNNCYMSSEKVTMGWDDARQWCKDRGADLVSITNEYEEAFLVSFLWGDGNNFWTGLTDRGTGYFVWIDQADLVYTNWQPYEPSGGDEGCVEMRITPESHGQWNDLDCSTEIPFACYVRKNPSVPAPAPTVSPIGCPAGFYSSTESKGCYKLVTTPATWNQARSSCQSMGDGIDLASVTEMWDNDLLYSYFFQDVSTDSLWFGLQFEVHDQSASPRYAWVDNWGVSYTNWDANEPNGLALQAGKGCGRMNMNGRWSLNPADNKADPAASTCDNLALPYVCKKNMQELPTEPQYPVIDGTCDPTWEFYNDRDCFYIEFGTSESEARSWLEARYSCQQRNADLASFHAPDEVSDFIKSLQGRSSHNLWIGLSSNGFEGWTWSDGSAYQYSNWATGEPNGLDAEDCAEMYPWDGTWNDNPCTDARGFICKRPKEFSQCKVALSERVECGFAGIDEDLCVEKRGCCWDQTFAGGNVSGCYYGGGGGKPVNPDNGGGSSSGGLSGGAIFGVILAVIVAVGAGVFGFIYYQKNVAGGGKMVPPTTYTNPSAAKDQPFAAGGFDNPNTA